MSATLLEQGLELMYFGMGTVIVFLSLLVVVTSMMSSLARRFEQPERPAAVRSRKSEGASSGPTPAVVAAITAAVHEHRQNSSRATREHS
ncbi:MAG: hypothetical protein CMN85_08720 [Spongiibacteraceae bacterium]|nr:hypothetical protein [Spongiibacteraceae bacterium]|tara:strand:+ start:453 stop:722 length:270 start_codon:yes stop_codon:yes gene_type:complete